MTGKRRGALTRPSSDSQKMVRLLVMTGTRAVTANVRHYFAKVPGSILGGNYELLKSATATKDLQPPLGSLPENILQIAGIAAACAALGLARSAHSKAAAIFAMIAAWLFLYFCCHGIAHWAIGRVLGIRFLFYTVLEEPAILEAILPVCAGYSSIFPSSECRPRKRRCRKPARRRRQSCGRRE